MFTFATQKGILLGIVIALAILLTVLLARGARARYGRCPIALAAIAKPMGPGGAIITGQQLHEGFLNELGMDLGAINDVLGLMEPDINAPAMNNNMATVLGYIKENPDKSAEFLNWVRRSYFTEKAYFRSPMDFAAIELPKTPLFVGTADTPAPPPAAAQGEADKALQDMPKSAAANIALRKITLYLSRYPEDTAAYLNYLKATFMTPDSTFKSPIDHTIINKQFENVFPVGT